MIEFKGELSDVCKKYMLKKETHKLAAIIINIPFFVVAIVVAFIWHWSMVIALPVILLFTILLCMPPSKRDYGAIFPLMIRIKDNGDMIVKGERFYWEQSISQVKSVTDNGDWYHIFFYYPHTNPRFVCQKNLISNGTIEEFEKLFEGKIIRKNNKIRPNS